MSMLSFLGLDGKARSVSKTEPLPVDIGQNVTVTMGSEVEVKNDVGSPVPVNPNIQRGAGSVTADTTRVVLANDGPTVTALNSIDAKTAAIIKTPTTTSVASTSTSATLLAANANRRGLAIYNNSTQVLTLSFTSPATAANCVYQMPSGSFLFLDQQLMVASAIYGFWAAANGTAQITEFV